MLNGRQHTLAKEITLKSIGLHTGRKISMKVLPADADAGITFIRKNGENSFATKSAYDAVTATTLATTIGADGASVSTVEHLMSAFFGLGIDNAVVELTGPEVPIMDGSAQEFVALLKSVGLATQTRKKFLVVTAPVSVEEGDGSATLLPSDRFELTYSIDFAHPSIGKQSYHVIFSQENYEKEIAPARTFGFLHDVERLQAVGLALGGSLANAVVLDENKVINKEGLRFSNEFVRHKILDAIGDLSLLGTPIQGHLVAHKSGHRLNNLLLRELVARKNCWHLDG
ncbi:MAG: UDP-3-O-acyl-N-acetylglucosamine deacetylase [Deltaproteobacteria bacterium]|nr:UDP-3-O-acyl-N-acetylglucosamine deacetylase [Deltaproteobacteria bacterium]